MEREGIAYSIKEQLPFLLRYEAVNRKYREGHADYCERETDPFLLRLTDEAAC
jgi:hypothetical protein